MDWSSLKVTLDLAVSLPVSGPILAVLITRRIDQDNRVREQIPATHLLPPKRTRTVVSFPPRRSTREELVGRGRLLAILIGACDHSVEIAPVEGAWLKIILSSQDVNRPCTS